MPISPGGTQINFSTHTHLRDGLLRHANAQKYTFHAHTSILLFSVCVYDLNRKKYKMLVVLMEQKISTGTSVWSVYLGSWNK
jgi:hypothetical protein